MLKYRNSIINKFLNRLKKIKTVRFNTKVVYKTDVDVVDEIVLKTTKSKLTFENIETLNYDPVEIWNAGKKIYTGVGREIEINLLDNTKDVIIKGSNIIKFTCYNCSVSILNIDKSTNLQELDCSSNKLYTLNVDKNINLQYLHCGSNNISTLNLNNLNLQELYCYNNKFTSINIDKNIALQKFSCSGNYLSSIDISKNIMLKSISCYNNKLSTLNVGENINLQDIYCRYNQLTNINIDKAINLQELDCQNNQLTPDSVIQILKFIGKRKVNKGTCYLNNNNTDFMQSQELAKALSTAKANGWIVYY